MKAIAGLFHMLILAVMMCCCQGCKVKKNISEVTTESKTEKETITGGTVEATTVQVEKTETEKVSNEDFDFEVRLDSGSVLISNSSGDLELIGSGVVKGNKKKEVVEDSRVEGTVTTKVDSSDFEKVKEKVQGKEEVKDREVRKTKFPVWIIIVLIVAGGAFVYFKFFAP